MSDFDANVFLNCPFDEEYFPLLRVLVFTVKKIKLTPRSALERSDSGEIRLHKIKELVEASKYSIHDLSRSKSTAKDQYFRLNMPFELGIDLGCRDYHPDESYRDKKILMLEKERYSTQKALSDLSFADCKCHKGDQEELVYEVRSWFSENGMKKLPPSSLIWDDYNVMYMNLYEKKYEENFKDKDIRRLSMKEFMYFIDEYLLNQ